MRHEEKLRLLFKIFPIFGIVASYGSLWENCAFLTNLCLNFLILFSYYEHDDDFISNPDDPNSVAINSANT